ncbi:hypothetical protein GQ53DRAFT_831772 [Thozetella sp. PMI_491]|nr:hypothetical protein GQ53DRAFT_831772 [Thozetella sp. PMI_491]
MFLQRTTAALAWLLATSATAQQLPWLRVTLAPQFNSTTQAVIALYGTLELNDTKSRAGRPLVTLDLNHGLTPTLRYDDDALTASDDTGALALTYTDTNDTDAKRTWVSARDPVGVVVFRFLAVPRQTNASTASGPRIDLRDDQGGVIGMATGFIPYPPAEEDWEVHLRWQIPTTAPVGSRFVSSLGDELESSAVGHPSTVLEKSYVAAGPLQRFPELGTNSTADGREIALYWIGKLPYDADWVANTIKGHFLAVSKFFSDLDSPFRTFMRRVWTGYGGAGGYQSFIMEYSNGTEEEQSPEALGNLLAHETIHSYALMFPTRQYDMWYREGVAVYYAVVAPYLGGAVDRQYLIRWLNNNAQSYYTSSTTNMTWQSVVDHYWTSLDIVKTPYGRGFIYLAAVQGLVARATNGTKGLDDIVLELYQMYLARQTTQSEQFLEVLARLVGQQQAEESYSNLTNGTLIVPAADGLAKFGLRMVRRDAERLEIGFTQNSSKVASLVPGSRAEQAGLREGDVIVRAWGVWGAGDSLDNLYQVVVLRDGQELPIKYWPRSHDKVENWVWEEIPDGECH